VALPRSVTDLLETAAGSAHRADPVSLRTGGPRGNAQLTAWTGLLFLALIAVELVTLLDVRGWMSWHLVVGVLLVPVALLKTGSTGWRIVRYYTGNRSYRTGGPPPMILRVVGPLVVLSTLGVLGSGLALIALGQQTSQQTWLTALGHQVSAVTLHQAFFIAFGAFTGLHLLARIVPAIQLSTARSTQYDARTGTPGKGPRALTVAVTLAAAAIAAALILPAAAGWQQGAGHAERPGSGTNARP
jgi:hypothetical protein